MATQKDFLGYPYDDAHPAFIELNNPPHPFNAEGDDKFVYHRGSGRIYDLAGLEARMAEMGYTPGANEIGEDDQWLAENTEYVPGNATFPDEPDTTTGLGLTMESAGGKTDTLTITISGPATADGTITVSGISVDGETVADATAAVTDAMTAAAAATAVATALDGLTAGTATLSASAAAGVVTVTNDGDPGIFDGNAVVTAA